MSQGGEAAGGSRGEGALRKGGMLLRFLMSVMPRRFHGMVTIPSEGGKATGVETGTRQMWRYQDLPEGMECERFTIAHGA